MQKEPMTKRGAKLLEDELNQLKSVERPSVIAAIAEAREHGDLKENAEYHAAREKQGFIEGRIQEIEGKLSNAQIIDVASLNAGGKVVSVEGLAPLPQACSCPCAEPEDQLRASGPG